VEVLIVVVTLVLIFAALLAALMMADRRSTGQVSLPWLWTFPSILVIGLSLLIGAARYPALPNQIPAHFDLSGVADRFVATTPFTAFFPIVMQVLVTAVLTAASGLVGRNPAAGLTGPALLIMAAGLDLAFFLLALPVWHGRTTLSTLTVTGAGLSVAAGLAAVVAAAVLARPRHTEQEPDERWRGAFYADRRDRRLFVPKRFGIGWTLNLGRPGGWALLITLIGIPVLTAFLGHLAA
jgi:uncharacterized membrane protein